MTRLSYTQTTFALVTIALIYLVPALRIKVESGSKAAIIALLVDGILIGISATKAFWP